MPEPTGPTEQSGREANELSTGSGSDESTSDRAQVEDPDLNYVESQPSTSLRPASDGDEPHLLPFPIVAIGGSAGGIEACIELLQHLPADTGMAFVVVSHLAPGHKSHLVEILAARTAMRVLAIADGMQPQPNHVYVLPPNKLLTMQLGVLHLTPKPEGRVSMVIDELFRSLAADQKNRVIGVVLSGMDADGALGLKTIKGEGGIAIVQAPESARFGDMPRSSIGADHVDLVLPPADIALELLRLASQFSKPELQFLEDGKSPAGQEQHFTRILNLLSTVNNVDFRGYKPATLQRRIARRMLLKRFESMQDYLRYLQIHSEELRDLHEDVLIGVTRFFRDPEVFAALRGEILPRILDQRSPEQQVRIWVAGCSSGEEVYSVAICLLECLSGEKIEPPIQIFGTDASENAVQSARLGIYPDSLAAEISPERLRRFFLKVDKGYQVTKRVRDLCIFAVQNLCTDPPFGHLDLITCRNVMIYLSTDLQKRIIPTFHYALRSRGVLLLGSSETIHGYSDLFTPLDRKNKFYAKLASESPVPIEVRRHIIIPGATTPGERVRYPARTDPWNESDLQRAADRIVLARYGPPGVIVNERMEILQSRGHTSPFMQMAQGTSSLHLLRMVRESIAGQVHEAVRRAVQQDVVVRTDNLVARNGEQSQAASLEVLPIHTVSARPRCYLVLFLTNPQQQTLQHAEQINKLSADEQSNYITQVQEDLDSTKLYLQSLIEERDSRNQELVSANEEIQSTNEELQSANEELETTKEELQSSNEELQTINEELQQRNAVLSETGNDLSNLLNSVNLPVLMLNNDLQIRQFTPLTERLMNIRASDIGRPIHEIRLDLSIEDLQPILHDVLDSLGTRELEVQDRDGRWRLLRVRPYRTADNKIEGVVLVLVDIDDVRRSQQELREARDFARAVIEGFQTSIVVLDMNLRVRSVNSAFRALSGLSTDSLETRSFPEIAALLWGLDKLRPKLESLAQQTNGLGAFEIEHDWNQGVEQRVLRIWAHPLLTDGDRIILLTVEDISTQKFSDRLEARLKEELEKQIQTTEQTLEYTRNELRALAGKLFTSQEEERRRVARELHDDITQRLAHLQMEIEQVEREPPQDPDDTRRTMAALRETAAHLSDNVRSISHRLHPSILEDLGLPEALKALVDEFGQREGMLTTFRRFNLPESIPYEIAGVLYRITQEALRNVAKHAGRTHVKVTLEGVDSIVRLEIRDSGEGFDQEGKRLGLGLVSMAERARLVRGSFHVESALGVGTSVVVEVPYLPDQTE